MNGGWIKLYRQLLDKPIWLESTPEQKVILITLLSMANHDEKEWEWQGKSYKAKPGQFVTSLESIRKKSGKGISFQNVRTALKRFEKYEFLTSEPTNKNRLITIVNWDVYQSKEHDLTDNLTSNQQATNKQLTTNKNYKNLKNNNIPLKKEKEDKKKYGEFENVLLSDKEIEKLMNKFPKDYESRIEKLSSYMASKNKKYKSHYATIINWANKEKPTQQQKTEKDDPALRIV